MSSEPSNDSNRRPLGSVTVQVYDAHNRIRSIQFHEGTSACECKSGDVLGPVPIEDEPPPALTPAQPLVRRTIEFRLTSSETQEQCRSRPGCGPPR